MREVLGGRRCCPASAGMPLPLPPGAHAEARPLPGLRPEIVEPRDPAGVKRPGVIRDGDELPGPDETEGDAVVVDVDGGGIGGFLYEGPLVEGDVHVLLLPVVAVLVVDHPGFVRPRQNLAPEILVGELLQELDVRVLAPKGFVVAGFPDGEARGNIPGGLHLPEAGLRVDLHPEWNPHPAVGDLLGPSPGGPAETPRVPVDGVPALDAVVGLLQQDPGIGGMRQIIGVVRCFAPRDDPFQGSVVRIVAVAAEEVHGGTRYLLLLVLLMVSMKFKVN